MKISEQKALLRKEMLIKRMTLSDKEITQRSLNLTEHFFSAEFIDKFTTFMAFMPFRNEIDTTHIIKKLLQEQKCIVLPKVDKKTNTIKALAVTDLENDLEKGAWDIKEPLASLPEVSPQEIDVILVPGIAFDKNYFRLGYGGGYYDRFLKETKALTIGVCFDFQIIEHVPTEQWDLPLDRLLSDKAWY